MWSLRVWLIATPVAVLIAWVFWSLVDLPGAALLRERSHAAAPQRESAAIRRTAPADRSPAARPAPDERTAERPRRAARPEGPPRAIERPRDVRSAGWVFDTLQRVTAPGSSVSLSTDEAFAIAEDLDAFRDSFAPVAAGPEIDALAPDAPKVPPDGANLRFTEGCHVWDTRPLNEAKDWPRDLTVSGAGINRTLVRITQPIRARGELRSLTLRDLTIHCNDDGLTDLRSRLPAAVRLLRCRVIGFDGGHGGCELFNGNVGAMLAEDSRIEMGYGRSPGSTELFDVRTGPCIVRMERCVLLGPIDFKLFSSTTAQVYVLQACELTDMRERLRWSFESPSENLRLRDCRVTYVPDDRPPAERRSVSQIVPGWTLPNLK